MPAAQMRNSLWWQHHKVISLWIWNLWPWAPPFIFTIYDKYIGLCFAKVSLCISVKEPECELHVVHWAPTQLDHTYSAVRRYMVYTTLLIRLHAGKEALQPKGTALTSVTKGLPELGPREWQVTTCDSVHEVGKDRRLAHQPPPHKEVDTD